MDKLRAAARQALEALELFGIDDMAYIKSEKAITALREALAEQSEQEPVACKHEWFRTGGMKIGELRCIRCGNWNYAAPVRTKNLTDDEIAQAVGSPLDEVYLADFRAVIAADR